MIALRATNYFVSSFQSQNRERDREIPIQSSSHHDFQPVESIQYEYARAKSVNLVAVGSAAIAQSKKKEATEVLIQNRTLERIVGWFTKEEDSTKEINTFIPSRSLVVLFIFLVTNRPSDIEFWWFPFISSYPTLPLFYSTRLSIETCDAMISLFAFIINGFRKKIP